MELNTQFKCMEHEYKRYPYPSLKERKELLLSIKNILRDRAYHIAEAVNKDFTHRSVEETLVLEIFPTISAIDYCVKKLRSWMKMRSRRVSWLFLTTKASLFPQPLGIVGNIVPWNYPIMLSLIPAIYALAAGNRVMIKMSELSNHTGELFQNLFHQGNLGNYLQVTTGDVEVSKRFSSLPFGHLLFTGSAQVGKQVMKTASDNLTPVTLELGGKSPALLSETMNLKYLNRLIMGKLFNAAQTCIAPDYLLMPTEWDDLLEEQIGLLLKKHYPNLMNNDDYSSIISEKHRLRLLELVEDARSKGAHVVSFGALDEHTNKLPFYLLFNVNFQMRVMQEEIFGPILPCLSYETFEEAVHYINSAPNPLALYYFGENKREIEILKRTTLSGALTINDTLIHSAIDDIPFGGVGFSGMGHYHGQEGFNTFSKLKPVVVQRRIATWPFLYPPYGCLMKHFLSFIVRIKPRGSE